MVSFLEEMGAKRAKDLINNPGENRNPFLTDIELLHFAQGNYSVSSQPFLSQWTRLYQIAWDDHKDVGHHQCVCCEIFKSIPQSLRSLPFSLKLLDEISKFRPSYKEVEDLMSKCEG